MVKKSCLTLSASHKQLKKRHMLSKLCSLLHFFPLAIIFLISAWGIIFLWQVALSDPRFALKGDTLAFGGSIKYCPESTVFFTNIAQEFSNRSLLDPYLLSDINRAYTNSPWIKEVVGIQKIFPNRLSIEFLLRLPVAQVKLGSLYYLLDNEGYLLPISASETRFTDLVEISTVGYSFSLSNFPTGSFVQDNDVLDALSIMRFFWSSPLADVLPIKRILIDRGDIHNRNLQIIPRYHLETYSGSYIRWGTYNSGVYKSELNSSEKIWLLMDLLRNEEALTPGVCFDVRTKLAGYELPENNF